MHIRLEKVLVVIPDHRFYVTILKLLRGVLRQIKWECIFVYFSIFRLKMRNNVLK